MEYRAYSIFDAKARAYAMPFFALNDGLAMRNVAMAMRDPSSVLGRHPEDFSLLALSWFDDATGIFFQRDGESGQPVVVCNLSQLMGGNGAES